MVTIRKLRVLAHIISIEIQLLVIPLQFFRYSYKKIFFSETFCETGPGEKLAYYYAF